jgi:hypothetical protein
MKMFEKEEVRGEMQESRKEKRGKINRLQGNYNI